MEVGGEEAAIAYLWNRHGEVVRGIAVGVSRSAHPSPQNIAVFDSAPFATTTTGWGEGAGRVPGGPSPSRICPDAAAGMRDDPSMPCDVAIF